jgi:hypothetical protein
MIDTFFIGQNDRLPYYRFQVRDQNGAVSLSNVSSVYFSLKNMSTASVILSGLAVITNALNGEGEYEWSVGDTAIIGEYAASFMFITTAGLPFTLPRSTMAKVVIEDKFATG